MRINPLGLLAFCTIVAGTRADEAAECRSLVDAAIKARGGAELLAKTRLMHRKASGTVVTVSGEAPLADEMTIQLPDRLHLTLEAGAAEDRTKVQIVVNGDKGWQVVGNNVVELGNRVQELREELYVVWLSTLLPLKDDNQIQISSLPEIIIDGNAAAGLKVTSKDHGDVQMYFNKQNRLLIKISRQASESGIKFEKEYVFSDYKPVEGVAMPTKYAELNNGKKFVVLNDIEYRFPTRVEDRTFAKP